MGFKIITIFSLILTIILSKKDSYKYESIKKIDQKYKAISDMIQNVIQNDSQLHNAAFKRLAYISDTYGPRMWGGEALEMVIDELVDVGIFEDFDKSYKDPVLDFTKWVRGKESLTLYDPRPFPQDIKMIGLGWSVPGDVKAEVLVVTDWDDLELKKDQVKGKIVCYAYQWTNYSHGVDYRSNGGWRASQYGAVGTLIRSVTPFSIESPHTGYQHYEDGYTKIPTAAISVEDANMFLRMQKRGQKIVVHLVMENEQVDNQNSANYIAQITGSENPEQVILFGGHMDSWDTGSQTGANDDGGGFITCFEALRVIKKLGLKPRRTMRMIGWSGEEFGADNNGAVQYAEQHKDELKNHVIAFESDLGSNTPYGFGFTGSDEAMEMINYINAEFLSNMTTKVVNPGGTMADTEPLSDEGVPTIRNLCEDFNDETHPYYFTFHHSAGDSMDILDPEAMDNNVMAIAAMMYIIADMEPTLPR